MATQTTDLLAAVGLPTYRAQVADESFMDSEHSARQHRSGHPRRFANLSPPTRSG
jgi:hypothetical protein